MPKGIKKRGCLSLRDRSPSFFIRDFIYALRHKIQEEKTTSFYPHLSRSDSFFFHHLLPLRDRYDKIRNVRVFTPFYYIFSSKAARGDRLSHEKRQGKKEMIKAIVYLA